MNNFEKIIKLWREIFQLIIALFALVCFFYIAYLDMNKNMGEIPFSHIFVFVMACFVLGSDKKS